MQQFAWWQSGIVYQVYPRSFHDSDGDGVGDLEGIRRRLDHLVALGIDALWISPIFPSPMADFGYDVSDYCDVHPMFGSFDDLDRLVADAHARDLKIILDYVPNHTSDRHEWFVESRASRSSEKRDWYIWRDPAPDGGPPNNWLSEFGGSAWTFDDATGQYYYHAYLKEQPDLNWRNADVGAAMLDVLRFWFERGIDGFRVDAIHHLIEDEALRDNPPNRDFTPAMAPARSVIRRFTMDQPEVHDAIAEMRRVADSWPGERLMIGEAYLPIDRLMAYYGADLTGFQLPFNFHLISTQWSAAAIAALIETYEEALPSGGWPNWVLGNHDRSRVATRLGPAQARIAAMLLLTLRGTPTIYQGEEIGMEDVPIPPEAVQDPFEKNVPGLGLGRDPERTPMQWSGEPNAGFTTGTPWLPLSADWRERNVDAESRDEASMLALYRRLIALRRAEPALAVGAYVPHSASDNVLAYERRYGGKRFAVALNLDGAAKHVTIGSGGGHVILSTSRTLDGVAVRLDRLDLPANEGVIVRLDAF